MTRAAFELLSERARRDVEGSRVVDLPDRRGASNDASAVFASRAEWAATSIRESRAGDRATVDASLGSVHAEARNAVVYTVVRGTLRADR